MSEHIVQSRIWGKFKGEYGTPAVRVSEIQYTLHKIPLTDIHIAYCPKCDPTKINWELLDNSLKKNDCVSINFDIPNIVKGSEKHKAAEQVFTTNTKCTKAPRNVFAKFNIILDLKKSEEELLKKMHRKRRYNIKYAQKKGVVVRKAESEKDFDIFYSLLRSTAERQKYYLHPQNYYKKAWNILSEEKKCHILIAEHEKTPLASWMLFTHDGVLYYPYGGSSIEKRNLFPSDLIGWEAIKLGKKLNCHTFDMWGAAENTNDKSDPWWGFTNFKLRYGGQYVEYMDSYDYVINSGLYNMFNLANNLRWKILKALK